MIKHACILAPFSFRLLPHSPLIVFPFQRLSFSLVNLGMASSDTISNVTSETPAAAAAHDEYGFQRPEMYSENLARTVDSYERHVFLCYKSHQAWASRVENSDLDPLPKLLASAFKARKNDISVKTKLTICEGGEDTEFADGDVLIFPEMIKYKGIKESDVDSFVEGELVNGKPWSSGVQEVLTGSHIFVCAHASRDKRCGVCGPILIQKLIEEIDIRGLKEEVFVHACSHVGGHKYAGNLIVYSPGPDGEVTGHWYGYFTPGDVPALLDQHIAKGEIIEQLWRGGMEESVQKAEKSDEPKLPNGEVINQHENNQLGSNNLSNNENVGCCQGANGFSCCRDSTMDKKSDTDAMQLNDVPDRKKGLGTFCSWIGAWDRSDVLTAAAVVGAVATVAVAYSLYRRSG